MIIPSLLQKSSPFFDSNFFVGLVTIAVGLAAFVLYKKQKDDAKKDAANILLLEIQNAERTIAQVKEQVEQGNLPSRTLLATNSWNIYKYLFVRDFDRDEWDIISEFYSSSEAYDEAIAYHASLFQKNEEQIRANMFSITAKYIQEHLDAQGRRKTAVSSAQEEKSMEEAFKKASHFQQVLLSRAGELLSYNPMKPVNDAKNALGRMNQRISQSTIGMKLKEIAKLGE